MSPDSDVGVALYGPPTPPARRLTMAVVRSDAMEGITAPLRPVSTALALEWAQDKGRVGQTMFVPCSWPPSSPRRPRRRKVHPVMECGVWEHRSTPAAGDERFLDSLSMLKDDSGLGAGVDAPRWHPFTIIAINSLMHTRYV